MVSIARAACRFRRRTRHQKPPRVSRCNRPARVKNQPSGLRLFPAESAFLRRIDTPNRQSAWRHANDAAHSLRPAVERRMSQEEPDIPAGRVFLHIEVYQTIPFVAQATIVEVAIEREKGGLIDSVQQTNDFPIFHSLASDVETNLTNAQSLLAEQES